MCIATSFAARYKTSKNKEELKLKMQVESVSCRAVNNDDFMYTMKDGSKILDRTIVNELQLFKSACL